MARIRSIHPALFTDEAFVCLSMAARVLFIGIWTEADDHGVFEWKPVALKMRIFPADNVDISGLLAELIDGKFVCTYPHEGRQYGAVRNFCKFQHPKKPAYRFFIPDEFLPWVGSSAQKGEPDDDEVASVPKKGEIPLQMEGREEEEGEKRESSLRSDSRTREAKIHDDWRPSAEDVAYAKALGLTEAEINRETEKFKNHARQQDRRCVDWSAAHRNWMVRAGERLGRAPPQSNGEAAKFVIRRGSLEAIAWEQHRGRPINFGRTDEATMPTQWPPFPEQSEAPQ